MISNILIEVVKASKENFAIRILDDGKGNPIGWFFLMQWKSDSADATVVRQFTKRPSKKELQELASSFLSIVSPGDSIKLTFGQY